MVQLAIHQEPLHQVDVFLAGGAGAAECAALDGPDHVRVSLRMLTRLTRVTGHHLQGENTRREDGE